MNLLEPLIRLIKHTPAILWATLAGLLEWFIPRWLYAKRVDKDIVLITGAGSGLGRELAIQYAKLNASLVLWDINNESLNETKKLVDKEHENVFMKLSSDKNNKSLTKRFCKTFVVDVSNRVKVYSAAKEVHEYLNSNECKNNDTDDAGERYISVLVNNAGIYHGLYLQELSDTQIERIFNINILAHFWTVRAFLPKMIEHQKGHIVEIASMGGMSGLIKQVDYCATKFATVGFEESLSIELEHMGLGDKIQTTAICPLFFQSNLFTGFDKNSTPLMSCEFVAREAVLAMRCNHSRVLLPHYSYILNFMKPITARRALLPWSKLLGFVEGIRDVKGAATKLD